MRRAYTMMLLTICVAGCGEPDGAEHTRLTQSIVFDELSVRQLSDQMIAAGEIGLDQDGRAERWQAAMAARATAEIEQFICVPADESGCEPCTVPSAEPSEGSAILASLTRLLAAHHTVRKPAGAAEARFEHRVIQATGSAPPDAPISSPSAVATSTAFSNRIPPYASRMAMRWDS